MMQYLTARYVDGGRGDGQYDCWGLSRAVRHDVYGKSLLPEYAGCSRHTPIALARGAESEIATALQQIDNPVPGCMVGVFASGICVHVAVAIGDNGHVRVMDITAQTGTSIYSISDFERLYYGREIRYYD